MYERKEIYLLEQVLPYVCTNKEAIPDSSKKVKIFDGDVMKMTSLRYQVFKYVSSKCVDCGLQGTFFAKERTYHSTQLNESYHFNLYGYDSNGNEVMLTKDHIRPVCKGGANRLINLTCRCVKCNVEKGDKWDGLSGH